MIKVNLIPVKRKKKAKPVPTTLIIGVFITLAALFLMGFLYFRATTKLSARKAQFTANENRLTELKEKIKAVENFEQLNNTYQQRSQIIEQLSKNKSAPVKLLDEISKLLPLGVWISDMTVTSSKIRITGYGYTNPDIVKYVDNIKSSTLFTDTYLQESVSDEISKTPLYRFRVTFRIKV